MILRSEKYLLFSFLSAIAILHFVISLFSEIPFDTGDGIQHYLISRYSWKHPELFLHLWGKPFFTLMSSPFAQFGLIGANAFNILCFVFTGYFSYKISQKFEIQFPLFAILFLSFSPIYFGTIQSGLTEPFFGFILIFCIYLFAEKKIFLSAVLISFLPFVRTEGFLILPLFFLILSYRKKYFFIPFLFLGTAVYSLAGYFFYNDFFWLVHQNPYKWGDKLYGKGEWYHFILRSEFIWGLPIFLLIIAGFSILFLNKKKPLAQTIIHSEFFPEEIILIYGSFVVYFFSHAVFWWKGLFGSLGLIRVMAGIVPVSALIALRGLGFISQFFPEKKHFKKFMNVLILLVPVICFGHYYFSVQTKKDETMLIKEAAAWLKNSENHNKKIFYLHPLLSIELGHDRFDRSSNGELWSINSEAPEIDLKQGEIIFWENHFSHVEGKINLEKLINNSSFQMLKNFSAENKLKNEKFEIFIFERK